jgi:hypothetical protein
METVFAEAVAAFRVFLEGQGERRELAWVTRGDLAWRGGLLVRIRAEAEDEAARMMKLAAERGFGFGLQAVAVVGDRLCCCVLTPANAEAAAEQLIGPPFVCKLRTKLPVGREPGWLEWLLARPAGEMLV